MTDSIAAQTSALRHEAQTAIGSVASDLRAAASQKYDETLTEVRARAEGAKTGVATEVQNVANALRHASEELRGGSAQERTLGQIASTIADASDVIRDKDLGEIVTMVRKAGRDHPALFLGGAALLGFVASRYLKASGDGRSVAAQLEAVSTFIDEGNPNTQPMGTAP
jgi:hypothetical protein